MKLEQRIEEKVKKFNEDFEFQGVIYKGQQHWRADVKKNRVGSYLKKALTSIAEEIENEYLTAIEWHAPLQSEDILLFIKEQRLKALNQKKV